jgi:hypothetical protein
MALASRPPELGTAQLLKEKLERFNSVMQEVGAALAGIGLPTSLALPSQLLGRAESLRERIVATAIGSAVPTASPTLALSVDPFVAREIPDMDPRY